MLCAARSITSFNSTSHVQCHTAKAIEKGAGHLVAVAYKHHGRWEREAYVALDLFCLHLLSSTSALLEKLLSLLTCAAACKH